MYVPVNRVFNNVSRNLGLNEYTRHIDTWAEWSFEAEQYIGSLDTFIEKEITYSTTTAQATATITWDAIPTEMSWLEINGTRFYFREGAKLIGSEQDHEITINTTRDLTLDDVVTKINDTYYTDTIRGITASHSSGVVTFTHSESGDAGNHVTLDTSGEGKMSNNTLEGGKERLHGKQARLPDNMVKMLSVRVGDTIIQPTSSQYKSKVSNLLDRFYINGNRLNFSRDDYSDDIVVTYLAVPMSPEGWPMVKQGHEEAVATYIMWKQKLIGYYTAEVPQYIVKDLEKRWYWLCAKVRGDDNMPSSIELLKIGKIWNSKTPITSYNPPLYDGLNSY